MSVDIPFFDFASFSEEITLDGLIYRFRFDWNVRKEFWTLSMLNVNLDKIISGIKLVLDYNLFDQYPGRGLPPGQLFAVDTTDEQGKINRTNLLEEVKLVYFTEDEIDAI
jgi:hypothetical protein